MKKGWKIFLVVCVSVFAVGLGLCLAGSAMGATYAGFRSVVGSHWIWTDNDFDDDFHDDYDDDYDYGEDSNHTSNDAKYVSGSSEYEYKASEISELDVEVSFVELDVKTYSEDVISIDASGLKDSVKKYLECKKEGNELKIELKDHRIWANTVNRSAGRMVVWIPEGLTFSSASFDIGAGYMKMENIVSTELDLTVAAGQIVVKDYTTDSLDADCGAGKMDITGAVGQKAEVSCGVGDLNMTLAGAQEDYDYSLSCGVGRLVVGTEKYSGLGAVRQINNGTGREFEIECGVGNVEVVFE